MKKFFKWLLIIFIVLFLTIVYARYIGTMGLVTKEYNIFDDKLPSSFDGLKIVHFSDIHYNRAINIDKIEKIVDEINLINPDIVVFTGDLIDKDVTLNSDDYRDLSNMLNLINSKYGKYAVMGNHDYEGHEDEIIKIYNDSDFKLLDNKHDIVYSKLNDKIFIGGIDSVAMGKDDIDKTMEYFDSNEDIEYKIILVHEPDIADNLVSDYSVNLILAGHSLNGQVRLPLIGALYTPKYAKKYYDEYYDIDGTNLYISSGVGVSIANYRLFNKPSINFYRLNKK